MSAIDPAPVESRRFPIRMPGPAWIAVMAIVLLAVAALVSVLMPVYTQRAAIRMVASLGGKVRIRPGGPDWLRRSVGSKTMAFFEEAEFASLHATSINEDQISRLGGLAHLQKLVLLGTPTGDRELRQIGRISGLRYLDLERTKVTDEGLASLAGLTRLESLDLSRNAIGDEGLWHLKSLKRLKQLRLYETDVTDEGIDALKRALPDLEIWTSSFADFEEVDADPPAESFIGNR
jgi:hypothetical protein